jgi:hypothetical protein
MARPRFVASVERRKMVRSMAAYGIRQEDIACCIGLRSAKTLRRHFREELDRAATEANARSSKSSSTSRYEREKRRYQPTAMRMIWGSNCRHLNSAGRGLVTSTPY